jgi:hypothetical protein
MLFCLNRHCDKLHIENPAKLKIFSKIAPDLSDTRG